MWHYKNFFRNTSRVTANLYPSACANYPSCGLAVVIRECSIDNTKYLIVAMRNNIINPKIVLRICPPVSLLKKLGILIVPELPELQSKDLYLLPARHMHASYIKFMKRWNLNHFYDEFNKTLECRMWWSSVFLIGCSSYNPILLNVFMKLFHNR